MHQSEIISGMVQVHKIPADLQAALTADVAVLAIWKDLTSLARNEWVCWVESAKLMETRERRIKRTITELLKGKRRPCCWIGCTHRTDKAISPSVQGILGKRSKKS